MSRKRYKKSAEAILTDLINSSNPGRLFKPDELIFGAPEADEGTNGSNSWNTKIEVTNKRSDKTQDIFYGRFNLADREDLVGLKITYKGQATVGECLEQINAASELSLTIDEVLNTELSGIFPNSLPYTFALKARPTSLICVGEVDITIIAGPDSGSAPPPAPPTPPSPPSVEEPPPGSSPPAPEDEEEEDAPMHPLLLKMRKRIRLGKKNKKTFSIIHPILLGG